MKLQLRNRASGNNQKRKLEDTQKKKIPSLHLFSFIYLFLCIAYFLFPNEKRRRRKGRREEKNERRKGRRKEGRKKGGVREEGKEKELWIL